MTQACHLKDRAIIRISGSDAHGWLQGLITNDIDLLSSDQALYSALLTPQGKILFDFFLIEEGDAILIDCERVRLEELKKRLKLYKLRSAVEIDQISELSVVALFGERSVARSGLSEKISGTATSAFGGIAYVDPRLAGMGVRVVGELQRIRDDLEFEGIEIGDAADYHQLRLRLGIPNDSTEIRPDVSFVLESNLEEMNGVSFSKGCYVGQEVTARTKHKGTLRKRILPLSTSGTLPDHQAPIIAGTSEIGTFLSGEGQRGLGLVRLDRLQDAQSSGIAPSIEDHEVEIVMPNWISI